jgi:hypothetical protein
MKLANFLGFTCFQGNQVDISFRNRQVTLTIMVSIIMREDIRLSTTSRGPLILGVTGMGGG